MTHARRVHQQTDQHQARGRTPKVTRKDNPTAASSQPSRETESAALVLRIPRRLESPNASRGAHWRVRHRISQVWADEIAWQIIALQAQEHGAKAANSCAFFALRYKRGEQIKMPVDQRMRVTVERHVPSRRNFIRDDDNLRFSVKPILDALKRGGFLKDDSRKWLDHPTPTQHVSDDKKDWTVITIEACA